MAGALSVPRKSGRIAGLYYGVGQGIYKENYVPDPLPSHVTGQLNLGLKGAGSMLLLVILGALVSDVALSLLLASIPSAWLTSAFAAYVLNALKAGLPRVLPPCVVFLVTWCSLKRKFRQVSSRELFREFGLTPASHSIQLCSLCGGIAYFLLLDYVLIPLFPPSAGQLPHPPSDLCGLSISATIGEIVAGVLLAPIAEEFLFRGVLYNSLKQHWNRSASIIIVSIMFSLLHPDAIAYAYWLTHVSLFLFPLLLALSREVTGSLSSPIFLHAGYNLAEYVAYLYE
jgi:membrane protease YdiL (CAAX protease family)